MKKIYIFLLFALFGVGEAMAMQLDSVTTVYRKGEFITICQRKVKVPTAVAIEVADKLVNDFHYSSSSLFSWALSGMGLEGKKNIELKINLKSATFDKKTGITHGNIDVIVPGIKTFDDIAIDAIVFRKMQSNGGVKVTAEILKSHFLLDKTVGTFTVIPLANGEQLLVSTLNIKFGWFFNIFITKNRYKSIVEWRVKKFTENMKAEFEKHYKEEKEN